ncbi:MAG TPA: SUMF1/EgtB/PvdO family nonheme iron enzyme, partial [Pyrinomonadaceae bacterium]|nr:SUMF1/EgtB/PvdO family nonheme iron enzyme [Pyrinomonadaceae bacterium]
LTGSAPVDAPTRDEQLEEGRPDPLVSIRQLNPKVPEAVARVIERALAVKRKFRFDSASVMRQALASAASEASLDGGAVPQVGALGASLDERDALKYAPPTAAPVHGLKTGVDGARGTRDAGQTNAESSGREQAAPPSWGTGVPYEPQPRSAGPVRRKSPILLIVLGVVAVAVVVATLLVMRNIRRNRRLARMSNTEATPSSGAAATTRLGGPAYSENLNGVPLDMVLVLGGTFEMGAAGDEGPYERPRHRVTVPNFYMGRYEVTQAQWRAVMGTQPFGFKGDGLPAERISWDDAVEFCQKLSAMTGLEYRLPTEAEWEYACRARTTTAFAYGDSLGSKQANFNGDYPYGTAARDDFLQRTTPVGYFKPNGFGLFDMHGNVTEWTADTFHVNYEGAPADGSAWVEGGDAQYKVQRGGSWQSAGERLRCAAREFATPETSTDSFGFRVVLVAP